MLVTLYGFRITESFLIGFLELMELLEACTLFFSRMTLMIDDTFQIEKMQMFASRLEPNLSLTNHKFLLQTLVVTYGV